MAKHSISAAARISGKSRSTLYRHIKSGRLSSELGSGGEPLIDTSELARVYGGLSHPDAEKGQAMEQSATPSFDAIETECAALRRENEALRTERDRWAAQAERLTALLVDHRSPKTRPRGLIERLFRRPD